MENKIDINRELKTLSEVLAQYVSGSEITRILEVCGLKDVDGEGITKHIRIFDSFAYVINNEHSDKKIMLFVQQVCYPAKFLGDINAFNQTKDSLNKILLFLGHKMDDSGAILDVEKTKTIDETLSRTNTLQLELAKRNIHKGVMKYSSKEYLSKDYFHACFEAIKGTFQRIRDITGENVDGYKLIEIVFSEKEPKLVINNMSTDSEKNEFNGLKNLLLFLLKSIRNVEAHETRLSNELQLEKALDIFTCISLANKYLDDAQITCFANK